MRKGKIFGKLQLNPWKCVGLLVAGLLAHGIVLFTDYILWDGYWYYSELNKSLGPTGMRRLFSEIGRPLDYYFLIPFTILPGAVPPKIFGLIVWVLSPFPLMMLLRHGAKLPSELSLSAALLASVLPVFDVLGEIAVWMNTFSWFVFLCGMTCLVYLPKALGLPKLFLRLATILLFLVAFNFNSLLVFFYAFAGFLFVGRAMVLPKERVFAYALDLVIRFGDFLLLPFLFWFAKNVLTPVHGYYADYNLPKLSVERLESGFSSLLYFLRGEGMDLTSSIGAIMLALLVGLVVVLGLATSSDSRQAKPSNPEWLSFGWLSLCGGGIMLVAAVLPYVVVGQSVSNSGWLSRNCILTSVPLALILSGLFLVLNQFLFPRRPHVWKGAIATIVVLGVIASNRNYLQWQALGVKQDSIELKLRASIAESHAVVVQLRDYFMIPHTIYYYPPIVWTFLAAGKSTTPFTFVFDTAQMIPHQVEKSVTGESQILFPQVPVTTPVLSEMIERTTMPYIFESIPTTGSQIMFIVQPGRFGSDGVSIGMKYLWLKWFRPSGILDFLDQATETHVLKLPPITSV